MGCAPFVFRSLAGLDGGLAEGAIGVGRKVDRRNDGLRLLLDSRVRPEAVVATVLKLPVNV